MIRNGIIFAVVGVVGLFGYFFVNRADVSDRGERARQAAADVGDTMMDQGTAGLVRARLASKFGLDAARYLHIYADDGQALIYGLRPPGVEDEQLKQEAAAVPGVRTVDLRLADRPAYLVPMVPASGGEG